MRTVIAGFLILVVCPNAFSQNEVRGTWLTTTGPDQIASGFNTASIVSQLKSIGINTVYTESWKNGYSQFPSPALAAKIGIDRVPSLGSRNLLDEVVIQAHRNGQIAIAWFEYGFASQFLGSGTPPPLNPLSTWASQNGWLLKDQSGNFANASNGFAWMNPAVPEVRQLLIDIVLDAVQNHDLDGIQFDDRLAWPREFGWDATTAALYQFETGRSLPSNVNDSAFRDWRQSKVTQFAQQLSSAIRAIRPDLHLSVSPSITGFSDTNYNAKWTDWVSQGLFDEYIPQVYRDSLTNFQSTLPSNVNAYLGAGGSPGDLIIGLRLNGSGPDTTQSVLQQQISLVRSSTAGQLGGHSIFYGKGLIDNASSMTSYYGGPSANPYFPVNHRPAPLVANLVGSIWQVDIGQAAHYRVVAEIGGRWQEVDSAYFAEGVTALSVPPASRVELLLDRRPYDPVDPPASIIATWVIHEAWTGSGASTDSVKFLAEEGLGPRTLGIDSVLNNAQGIQSILMIVENLREPILLGPDDFEVLQSPLGAFDPVQSPPTTWGPTQSPEVIVIEGLPSVVIVRWNSQSIMNRWIRITMKANSITGLEQPKTFYLGHLLGETTGLQGSAFTVQFADIAAIRGQIGSVVTAGSIHDIDKNGTVQFSDISAMRNAVGTSLSTIVIP